MKFNLKKKKFLFLIFTIIFLSPNFFWLYLSYKNKTFPYYELGYLYRKIDREINKLFSSEKDYALKIINKQYIENNIFYDLKDQEERIEFNKQLKNVIEKYFIQYFKNNKEILKIMKKLIV